ncbi:putative hypercellular protein [Rosellinia necatrix]|uniref:Putative hypercellular protein n=1 Tax=Rosellinia necatrix TaxID=77044 RepID=A0A1W2TVQ2_ROSNE|nr:putative hypercellular protein [Rosellinia necatrix]
MMSLDTLSPIAPARVRALVLPIGQIRRARFQSFADRLHQEHVVQLRDISADGRPNRNMFSPLAFPDGAIFYDLITYIPPPSHLALAPFDLFREPLAVIAIADGGELEKPSFSKRLSTNGHAPTTAEKNIRTLYQELENLRDAYPKVLTHHVLIFDYTPSSENTIPLPEGIQAIPPLEHSKRTTMKTVMCDISSVLLAEMNTLAKSFEAMTSVDSPGQAPGRPGLLGAGSWTSDDVNPTARRNSQFAVSTMARSASTSGAVDRSQARMSMPPFKSLPLSSGNSTPSPRPSTPVRSGLSNPPTTFDDISANGTNLGPSSPEHKNAEENAKLTNQDKIATQGFGPGSLNEKWRSKGKGRATIIVGSLYLQAGRWTDALKELVEGATVAKSINDHLWHGKALELVFISLLMLAWAGHEFQVPAVCLPPNEKGSSSLAKAQDAGEVDPTQPKYLRNFQVVLPDLLERIIGLYSRISGEQLPPFPLSETIIRFCNTLTALHLCEGRLGKESLDLMIFGKYPPKVLDTSPRLTITPSRVQINNFLFKAFPSSAPELISATDRSIILSGISTILGILGYHRKKALVIRELISVLIGGLVEARTRGAAEVGIHPAAGLVALNAINGQGKGAGALDINESDIEQGIDAFLGALCKIYGVVSFEDIESESEVSSSSSNLDTKVISRINSQSAMRHFGFPNVKLNIIRACINFSEALPDFHGVLKFSSDLLRTAGSGVAPGTRRENAAPIISRDEQIRLVTNISKTSSLSQRMGLEHLSAEYWDEFLIRGITLDPVPMTRPPIPHSKNVLPGATTVRTSQDVNPFIYNPFLRTADKSIVAQTLVAGEAATFRLVIQNPFEIDLEIDSIKLHAEGIDFDSSVLSTVIGPYRTQILKIQGTPQSAGSLKITGAVIRVLGCRERWFPIFSQPWTPEQELKMKGIGLGALKQIQTLPPPGSPLKADTIDLSVIDAQPIILIKSTTLPQSSIMILEGEKRTFSVTLHNISTTPADLILFSFQDSTQGPLHTALASRDATPAELYEYEWVLAKKQALRLCRIDDSKRYIAPGSTATFEFEILGKPGLTSGTIQVDYAHLGMPQSEIKSQFFTRQACLDLTVTVNPSVELSRVDILPVQANVPKSIWDRVGSGNIAKPVAPGDYCLLVLDLRNTWRSNMQVSLKSGKDITLEEHILPGNTNRVVVPVPRVYIEDPHASIPALNPSRQRQFVVSSSKITPDMERGNREAFWYREKMLESVTGTWKTLSGATREGTIQLRSIRLTPRMIEAIKINEVGIDISVESLQPEQSRSPANSIHVDEFAQIKVQITNRTNEPIYPTVRIMPSLCNRPANIALDFTRKFAWNGALQQTLPLLDAKSSTELQIGATALCRGEFEISASVEETRLWKKTAPEKSKRESGQLAQPEDDEQETRRQRERADTQAMIEAVLGVKERRIWHSRRPCIVTVRDRPESGEE